MDPVQADFNTLLSVAVPETVLCPLCNAPHAGAMCDFPMRLQPGEVVMYAVPDNFLFGADEQLAEELAAMAAVSAAVSAAQAACADGAGAVATGQVLAMDNGSDPSAEDDVDMDVDMEADVDPVPPPPPPPQPSPPTAPSEAELKKLSYKALQARCKATGLKANGKKAVLIQRLLQA